MSCHQSAGQNHNIKIASRSLENVANCTYFGMTLKNQNYTHEEIMSRLN
jgi:hypothetical protein